MSDRMVELIFNMIDYIKDIETTMDDEWGFSRSFSQLLEDEEVPEIFFDCTNMLKFIGIDDRDISSRIKGDE
jgi:hypothetical protein